MIITRYDLRELLVKIIRHDKSPDTCNVMDINIRWSEMDPNDNIGHVFKTDNWAILIFRETWGDEQVVVTDDIEKFERDICLIKMAVS